MKIVITGYSEKEVQMRVFDSLDQNPSWKVIGEVGRQKIGKASYHPTKWMAVLDCGVKS